MGLRPSRFCVLFQHILMTKTPLRIATGLWSGGQPKTVKGSPDPRLRAAPAPHAPIPRRFLVDHGSHLLLIGEVLLEDHLAVILIRGLIAGIEALANDRVGIKPDRIAILRLLDKSVRRQRFDRRDLGRAVGRADDETGCRQQVFLGRDRLLARAEREGRGQNQGGGEFLHGNILSDWSRHQGRLIH